MLTISVAVLLALLIVVILLCGVAFTFGVTAMGWALAAIAWILLCVAGLKYLTGD